MKIKSLGYISIGLLSLTVLYLVSINESIKPLVSNTIIAICVILLTMIVIKITHEFNKNELVLEKNSKEELLYVTTEIKGNNNKV